VKQVKNNAKKKCPKKKCPKKDIPGLQRATAAEKVYIKFAGILPVSKGKK